MTSSHTNVTFWYQSTFLDFPRKHQRARGRLDGDGGGSGGGGGTIINGDGGGGGVGGSVGGGDARSCAVNVQVLECFEQAISLILGRNSEKSVYCDFTAQMY